MLRETTLEIACRPIHERWEHLYSDESRPLIIRPANVDNVVEYGLYFSGGSSSTMTRAVHAVYIQGGPKK